MSKLKKILIIFLVLFSIVFTFFFIGTPPQAEQVKWGVNFSSKHAWLLGLDWREVYTALLDDLGAKRIKVITYWDMIEDKQGKYNFEEVDWQIQEAEKRNAKILLVIGMKTPRWPECHIPLWAKGLSKEKQQEHILKLIENIVIRYEDSFPVQDGDNGNIDAIPVQDGIDTIWGWQVENEPFFPFGDCPWADREFVKKEVELVKSLDSKNRPILISDSGEGSFWITAAKTGDMVGTTLYKKVWARQINRYISYPIPAVFYWRKAQIIKKLFNKKVIGVELQAEPWGPTLLYDSSLQEQSKSMNLEQFKYVVNFAKKTGLDEFYFWGAEWWYLMKTEHNQPEIWNEAKNLF